MLWYPKKKLGVSISKSQGVITTPLGRRVTKRLRKTWVNQAEGSLFVKVYLSRCKHDLKLKPLISSQGVYLIWVLTFGSPGLRIDS